MAKSKTPRKAVTRKKETRPPPGVHGYSEAVRAKALVAFRKTGTVQAACEAASIARKTWYDWVANDSAFQEAVDEATDFVTDDLEKEAIKRAKEGSDTLIIFLLKSRRRHIYGDKVTVDIQNDPRFREAAQQYGALVDRALEVIPREQQTLVRARIQELVQLGLPV